MDWAKRNKNKRLEASRRFYKNHKDDIKKYFEGRKVIKKEYDKAYRLLNIDKYRLSRKINSHKRRLRKKSQQGVVTKERIANLVVLQKNRCIACKVSFKKTGYHIDHIVPIAKGGLHDDSNLQLLCPYCNQSKGAKDDSYLMQKNGYLI